MVKFLDEVKVLSNSPREIRVWIYVDTRTAQKYKVADYHPNASQRLFNKNSFPQSSRRSCHSCFAILGHAGTQTVINQTQYLELPQLFIREVMSTCSKYGKRTDPLWLVDFWADRNKLFKQIFQAGNVVEFRVLPDQCFKTAANREVPEQPGRNTAQTLLSSVQGAQEERGKRVQLHIMNIRADSKLNDQICDPMSGSLKADLLQ
ncbi:hypothetical protein CSKR_112144 [Clonorchis sinensis]|uniref:Uncharacterized protein n=1 Tax=Clonorchis sinensis TaxID=79923 RepID=A0A419PCE5_CLOSI|nr:hypothetical protein CSKR_112144 [Clonorchis sinensis]